MTFTLIEIPMHVKVLEPLRHPKHASTLAAATLARHSGTRIISSENTEACKMYNVRRTATADI